VTKEQANSCQQEKSSTADPATKQADTTANEHVASNATIKRKWEAAFATTRFVMSPYERKLSPATTHGDFATASAAISLWEICFGCHQ
jgi:hypothetical protein